MGPTRPGLPARRGWELTAQPQVQPLPHEQSSPHEQSWLAHESPQEQASSHEHALPLAQEQSSWLEHEHESPQEQHEQFSPQAQDGPHEQHEQALSQEQEPAPPLHSSVEIPITTEASMETMIRLLAGTSPASKDSVK